MSEPRILAGGPDRASGPSTPEPGASAEPAPRERDPRVRATHRRALIVIFVLCLLLAAIGFAYARWLMTQPIPLKIPGGH